MNGDCSAASSSTTAVLFDKTACQEFADLMAGDFEHLCTGFMADMTDAVNQIAALSGTHADEISALAHKYKSAAGYLGAFRLRELLVELESHAIKGDTQACGPLALQAVQTNQDTLVALQAFIDEQH